MTIQRRRFLELAAGALGAATITGCASVVALPVVPRDGVISLVLRDHPQLDRPGGYLRLLPAESAAPIYVLAIEAGGYVALSPICTHLGCTVNIEGQLLVCPCHGSTYDRIGRVLRGPAERSLRQYPLAVTPEGELIIEMGGEA